MLDDFPSLWVFRIINWYHILATSKYVWFPIYFVLFYWVLTFYFYIVNKLHSLFFSLLKLFLLEKWESLIQKRQSLVAFLLFNIKIYSDLVLNNSSPNSENWLFSQGFLILLSWKCYLKTIISVIKMFTATAFVIAFRIFHGISKVIGFMLNRIKKVCTTFLIHV